MNKNRRISFLVNLKGLAQGLGPQEIHTVGYTENEWVTNEMRKTWESWELWLQSGRLDSYNDEDFPDIESEEKERIPALIREFDDFASRYPDLADAEKARALHALVSIIGIFETQLQNTHGEQ